MKHQYPEKYKNVINLFQMKIDHQNQIKQIQEKWTPKSPEKGQELFKRQIRWIKEKMDPESHSISKRTDKANLR